jgi:hypothetical protein
MKRQPVKVINKLLAALVESENENRLWQKWLVDLVRGSEESYTIYLARAKEPPEKNKKSKDLSYEEILARSQKIKLRVLKKEVKNTDV